MLNTSSFIQDWTWVANSIFDDDTDIDIYIYMLKLFWAVSKILYDNNQYIKHTSSLRR